MNKKGQIAIFVIIALVIAGIIIVIFAFPKIGNIVTQREIVPESYLEKCISDDVKKSVDLLAMQGGDENPVGYIEYKGIKTKYLCYKASEDSKTCVVQQPLLISHFSNELSRILTPKLEECIKSLETEYKKKGYSVQRGNINTSVIIGIDKIMISFNSPLTISNEKGARKFEKFDVNIDSKIYELLSIATSITEFEATYGDSETTLYMQYYPDLKIEKLKLEDGTKIYILTNVVSNDEFRFASRSLVWTVGYTTAT